MAIYSYIITRDYGFAPNPFYGVCSLATCKPGIRRNAEVGDWILGFGSNNKKSKYRKKLIFAMKVEEKITMDSYWEDARFRCKRPVPNGSLKQNYGDNIYYKVKGEWVQEDSHHSLENGEINKLNLDKDTGGLYVLLSTQYWYWGKEARDVPENLKEFIPECRNYKKFSIDPTKLENWLNSLDEKGYIGEPDKFSGGFKRYNGK